jgi:hypothetical protein
MVTRPALMVEEIINGFPKPVLPKIDHEPTSEDIQVTTRLLNTNTIYVPSLSGGGVHIHMSIIMTQLEYTVISSTPWVDPYDPVTIPIIATGTNPINTAQIVRIHHEFMYIHTIPVNVEQAIN